MSSQSTSIESITTDFFVGANVCSDRNCDESEARRSRWKEGFPIPAIEALDHHAKAIDKIWAKEIYEICKEDREAILDELHGVRSRSIPETRERIRLALDAMEQEISGKVRSCSANAAPSATAKLVAGHIEAVETLRSAYVVSPEFRIRFLRAEFFDASSAALRYFRCLNFLLSLFGVVALERPLKLSDLSDREKLFLESGRVQPLLSRDTMGRRIYLVFAGKLSSFSLGERIKVETYVIFGVMAEDEETQLHGAVSIILMGGEGRGRHSVNATTAAGNEALSTAWDQKEKKVLKKHWGKGFTGTKVYIEKYLAEPIRFSSIHICMPDERLYRLFKSFALGCIPSKYRVLTRVHIGSHLERTYELCQFGIPVQDLPGSISSKGTPTMIKTKSMTKFLKARTAIDAYREEHSKNYDAGCYRSSARDTCTTSGDETDTPAPETPKSPQPPPVQLPTEDFCPGTDCPESNCVVFGDRSTYKYPANVAFREYLQIKEQQYLDGSGSVALSPPEPPMTITSALPIAPKVAFGNTLAAVITTNMVEPLLRLDVEVLDQMIDELCFDHPDMAAAGADNVGESPFMPWSTNSRQRKGFKFATYDKIAGWYRYIDPIRNESDRIELRKRISQTMRDDRKRTIKNNKKINQYQTKSFGGGEGEGGEPSSSRCEPMLSFTQGEHFLGSDRMEQGIPTRSSIDFGVKSGWNSWKSNPGFLDSCTKHVSDARDNEFDSTKRFKTH